MGIVSPFNSKIGKGWVFQGMICGVVVVLLSILRSQKLVGT